MPTLAVRQRRLPPVVADIGGILLAWLPLLVLEHLAVGMGQRDLLSASWEMGLARKLVTPIALAALLPCACAAVALGRLIDRASHDPGSRRFVTTLAMVASLALGEGVSFGRHMASMAVRAPFLLALGAVGAAVGWFAVPRLARAVRAPRVAVVAGTLVALACWYADLAVLPRLYPAFHLALFVLTLGSAAVASLAWRAPRPENRRLVAGLEGTLVVLAALSIAWAPAAARRLRVADNLRLILTEHAPLLGRAVRLAAILAPPPPLDDPGGDPTWVTSAVGEIPRVLDWSGHDVLLLSVDALRADHVSSYGYSRPTTPSLDALAAEGARFEYAYCPTPHTSYSITSMMTGKAMRPLLSLGLGGGSETWAAALRRYGFRTAAFYPPAVFFIDGERFEDFAASGLDFEYRKVEFAPAADRVAEVNAYLEAAPRAPLFLWVHFFEPHEPYEMHAAHPFGPPRGALPIDAYDSEIAEADDAIGRTVRLFRAARPGAAVIVTADHGEEFGEHGGRYHGTSCYEEQVRVPLVVVGPGVLPRQVATVVQTIDLLPTVLSALGIPRPARVRGRDLGPLLAGREVAPDAGLAYAETDEYTLLARATDRLVCARKIGACALYDLAEDPAERHDLGAGAPLARELRRMTAAIERDQGRFEGQGGAEWPDALRRGLQGEADAAEDVAALLDDPKVLVRRKAAEVLFRLRAPAVAAALRRTFARDEDEEVRRWTVLALVRIGEAPQPLADALVRDPGRDWRRRAALAFADRGDARGAGELAAWWNEEAPPGSGLDIESGKELLAAVAHVRDAAAVPGLLASLDFVPLRPWIADALGAIGDARARAPLLASLQEERYVTARPHEARALLLLGARREILPPLARFAGIPEPMPEAIAIARDARLLDARTGGVSLDVPVNVLSATVTVPAGLPLRLLALAAEPGGTLSGTAGGRPLGEDLGTGTLHVVELGPSASREAALDLHDDRGLLAAWVVPRATDVPPPAPEPFDLDDAGRPPHHN